MVSTTSSNRSFLLHDYVGFLDEEIVVTSTQLVVVALVEEGVGNDGALIDRTEHVETTIDIVPYPDGSRMLFGNELRAMTTDPILSTQILVEDPSLNIVHTHLAPRRTTLQEDATTQSVVLHP